MNPFHERLIRTASFTMLELMLQQNTTFLAEPGIRPKLKKKERKLIEALLADARHRHVQQLPQAAADPEPRGIVPREDN